MIVAIFEPTSTKVSCQCSRLWNSEEVDQGIRGYCREAYFVARFAGAIHPGGKATGCVTSGLAQRAAKERPENNFPN